MKTTIEFEDELYRQLKATAALRGRKVKDLVEEAVRMVLHSSWKPVDPSIRVELPLIPTRRKAPLDIPDDIAARLDSLSDREGHAASLR
jgi:predicted transcriptional regulator